MLEEFSIVQLRFKGQMPGLNVPKNLRNEDHCMVEIGLNMPIPIPDLELVERGVFATLSFSRNAFRCFIPWEAVFAMSDKDSGKGVAWPGSMPAETTRKERPVAKASHLRLVK